MKVRLLLGLCSFLLSCHSKNDTIYSKREAFENGWSYDKPIRFIVSLEEMDKNQYLDFFLLLRNNDSYPFENLFLIANFKDPKTVFYRDTLEYLMADKVGRSLGSGFGSNKKSKLVLKEKYPIPSKGPFEVEIRHAMRNIDEETPLSNLPGIISLELQINKASP